MKENRFAEQDFSARLHGTICRYERVPYKLHVDGREIHLVDINSGDIFKTINPRDKLLDVSSVPLGYMNLRETAVYVRRQPTREIYRQGVCDRNVTFHCLGDDKNRIRGISIVSKEAVKMMMSIYPDLPTCLKKLRSREVVSIATSNTVALSINDIGVINVYNRNDLIGYMAPDSDIVNVPNDEMGWLVSTEIGTLGWAVV